MAHIIKKLQTASKTKGLSKRSEGEGGDPNEEEEEDDADDDESEEELKQGA